MKPTNLTLVLTVALFLVQACLALCSVPTAFRGASALLMALFGN